MSAGKTWVHVIDRYCLMPADQRTEIRREVARSHNKVRATAIQLASLIDRLS